MVRAPPALFQASFSVFIRVLVPKRKGICTHTHTPGATLPSKRGVVKKYTRRPLIWLGVADPSCTEGKHGTSEKKQNKGKEEATYICYTSRKINEKKTMLDVFLKTV